MVKLIAPMMSGEAHGSIGHILTFKKRGRTNIGCRYFKPRNPNSPAQQTVRTRTRSAVARWKAATGATKDAWRVYAKAYPGTGNNMYTGAFMRYMRDNGEATPAAPFLPS